MWRRPSCLLVNATRRLVLLPPGGNGAASSVTSELLAITDGVANGAWTPYINQINHAAHEAIVLTSFNGTTVRSLRMCILPPLPPNKPSCTEYRFLDSFAFLKDGRFICSSAWPPSQA